MIEVSIVRRYARLVSAANERGLQALDDDARIRWGKCVLDLVHRMARELGV